MIRSVSFQMKMLACLAVSFFAVSCSQAAPVPGVRKPCVSGQFYPDSPDELKALIRTYLSKAPAATDSAVRALIVPHAGYPYSGPVAAEAYKTIAGQKYDAVILIGFTHRVPFRGIFVDTASAYETPLGQVPIDRGLAEAIRSANPVLQGGPAGGSLEEHSLEVQVPFLQTVLSDLKIVPIYMSLQDVQSAGILADAVAKAIKGKNVLVVVSTDLSHYHPYDKAVAMDRTLLGMVERADLKEFAAEVGRGTIEACGTGPVMSLLILAQEMGWEKPRLIRYANSGDVTGSRGQVVGYAAVAVDSK